MASTNCDTDRKRRMTPAWDPPKLLLVVSGLNVVVGTLGVVGFIVNSGIWLLGSNVWSQQSSIERGKRGSKATVSTHPKYSQARSYTTYICIGIKWIKGIICGLNYRMLE